jgi:hypothetical protein
MCRRRAHPDVAREGELVKGIVGGAVPVLYPGAFRAGVLMAVAGLVR